MGATKRVQAALTWADALSVATASDEVPEGWSTTRQIADEIGRSDVVAGRRLRALLLAGRAEQRLFRIAVGNRVIPVPHYRLKS
jgi:hypothetical protein